MTREDLLMFAQANYEANNVCGNEDKFFWLMGEESVNVLTSEEYIQRPSGGVVNTLFGVNVHYDYYDPLVFKLFKDVTV